MASRTLEITLISAKDLKNVNFLSKMEVYAIFFIDGDNSTAQRTTADQNGGTNPSWNATFRVPVPADDPSSHVVHVILLTKCTRGERDVGEVHIPLNEFFSGSGYANTPQFISYQVRKPSSWKPRGILNLSFKISDACPTATTYHPSASMAGGYSPAYPPAASYPSYGYPPPQAPPAGYGYGAPPQWYGYGAVPPQQPQMKYKFGRGLIIAILGDSIGGLLADGLTSDAGFFDF